MGDFKIVIEAVGGHGCADGSQIGFTDSEGKFQPSYQKEREVRDDLLTGKRTGSFK